MVEIKERILNNIIISSIELNKKVERSKLFEIEEREFSVIDRKIIIDIIDLYEYGCNILKIKSLIIGKYEYEIKNYIDKDYVNEVLDRNEKFYYE